MTRTTIGENPLDLLLKPSEHKDVESQKSVNIAVTEKKQRLTVQISQKTVEEGKNAVYWCRGMTYAKLVETGLKRAIKELEKKVTIHDEATGKILKKQGEKFPERKESLKSGRPIKS